MRREDGGGDGAEDFRGTRVGGESRTAIERKGGPVRRRAVVGREERKFSRGENSSNTTQVSAGEKQGATFCKRNGRSDRELFQSVERLTVDSDLAREETVTTVTQPGRQCSVQSEQLTPASGINKRRWVLASGGREDTLKAGQAIQPKSRRVTPVPIPASRQATHREERDWQEVLFNSYLDVDSCTGTGQEGRKVEKSVLEEEREQHGRW